MLLSRTAVRLAARLSAPMRRHRRARLRRSGTACGVIPAVGGTLCVGVGKALNGCITIVTSLLPCGSSSSGTAGISDTSSSPSGSEAETCTGRTVSSGSGRGTWGLGAPYDGPLPDEASLTPPIEGNITSGMSHAGLSRNCMPSSSAACCPAAPAPSCAAGSVLPSAAVGTGTFPMTLVAAPAASAATASPSATALYSAACRSRPVQCPAQRHVPLFRAVPRRRRHRPIAYHAHALHARSSSAPDSCPLSGIRPAFCSLLWPFHRHIQRSRHYIRYRPDHVMRRYAQGSMSSLPQAMSIVTASPSQPRCRHGRATKRTVAGESRATT